MRVPVEWLRAYCDPELDARTLATRLAMTGTEVDRILAHGVAGLEHFVVGRVLTAEPHPDADRLRVCTVDVGQDEAAHIVCGAPNVAAGQTVAVARPGAVMPDGTRLKRAKLRGQVSEGMILAEDELAIGTDHDGIMVLDDDLVPGAPLADVLPLATEVLELEITPNRPDCLAVYGVARELHAATDAPLAPPPWAEDIGTAGAPEGAQVLVEATDLCPRFTARVFEDVVVGPSPPWLKARLMAAGQRPISNVVDVTNYVMLATGQPLHAFDLDRVAGGRLTVRHARAGETMTTLDGLERTLDEDVCLIADDDGPTSIAGLMGGERSEVSASTTRVLMEAAAWDGPALMRTSARLGLRTEASGRFEKGLAPEQALQGQVLATRLMVEVCGARLVPGTIDAGGDGAAAAKLGLRLARIERLLGARVTAEEVAHVLASLGFALTEAASEDGFDVTVPAHRRNDVTREIDLIEEVARLVVLERLPATLPSRRGATGRLSASQRQRRRAEDALVGAGLSEAVGWSFEAPGLAARLERDGDDGGIRLQNPMSEDQSVMRRSLIGSLLDAVRGNRARGAADVRLFEVGAVYPGDAEPQHLAALLTGALRPASWREAEPPRADFFTAKATIATVLDALRVEWSVVSGAESLAGATHGVAPASGSAEDGVPPFLHPGRAATVVVDGTPVGWLGEIHPRVAARWDLESTVAGFEVDLGRVLAAADAVPAYADLTSFPSVRQDVAVVVADDVPAARVLEVIQGAGGALLADARVFDVYRGAQVGEGSASLALRLEFRAPDRTLTDEEVAQRRGKIVAALRDELGGELRG